MSKRKKNRDLWRQQWKTPRCVIAFDQSYTCTGIAVAVDDSVRLVRWESFKGCKTKTDKRKRLRLVSEKVIKKALTKFSPCDIIVLVERIRTITNHRNEDLVTGKPILSTDYIKSTGALVAMIVDVATEYGIKVYSVATVAWKAQILGSSKPLVEFIEGVKDPQKIASVKNAIKLGYGEQIKITSTNGRGYKYCDDAADALNISLYGFLPPKKLNLHREE